MSSILIIDSGADLPRSYVEEHNLVFMPMSYAFGNAVYSDDMGDSMPFPEFYNLLREGKTSVTAQVTPKQFFDAMRPYLQKGIDILYIAFSSGLSGTCQSGQLAQETLSKEFPDRQVLVVDTFAASAGLALMIDHAVRMHKEGVELAKIAQWLEDNKRFVQQWFTVDDINHLRRGGRVSGAAAFAGTLLSIKPTLYINNEGLLIPLGKSRGRRKALRDMVDRMEELGENLSDQRIFISHGDTPEDAEYVADMIRQRFGITDIMITYIGPIIGSHGGPGILLLAFMGKDRQAFTVK